MLGKYFVFLTILFIAIILVNLFTFNSAKASSPQFRVLTNGKFFDYDPETKMVNSINFTQNSFDNNNYGGMVTSEDGKYIYISFENPYTNTNIYQSSDCGTTWQAKYIFNNFDPRQRVHPPYYLYYTDPTGQYTYGGNGDWDNLGWPLSWSTDFGGNWTLMGNYDGRDAPPYAKITGPVENIVFGALHVPIRNPRSLTLAQSCMGNPSVGEPGSGGYIFGAPANLASGTVYFLLWNNWGGHTALYASRDGGNCYNSKPVLFWDGAASALIQANGIRYAIGNSGKDVALYGFRNNSNYIYISHDFGNTFVRHDGIISDTAEALFDPTTSDLYHFGIKNDNTVTIRKYLAAGGPGAIIDELNLNNIPNTTNLPSPDGLVTHRFNLTSTNSCPRSDFSIAAEPKSQTIAAGQSTSYTVTVSADHDNGFQGTVALSASVANGSGFTTTFSSSTVNINNDFQTATLTVHSPTTASAGSHTITITGTDTSGKVEPESTAVNLEIIRLKIIGDVFAGTRIGNIYIEPGSVASATQTVEASGTSYKISSYDPANLVKWGLAKQKMANTIQRLNKERAVTPTTTNVSPWYLDTESNNPGVGPSAPGKYPDGKVWHVSGNLTLGATTFFGRGTIIVDGNVNINGNLTYGDTNSSLGIIAYKDSITPYNININPSVTSLVGAYYTIGNVNIR